MQANEFEKRVQDRMQELNLDPSPAVWDSVERRIRKEKKRRFLPWWPIALLLAGAGITAGILLWGNKEKTVPVTVRQDQKTEVPQKPVVVSEPSINNNTTVNKEGQAPGEKITKENDTTIPERDVTETAITNVMPGPAKPVLQRKPSVEKDRTTVPVKPEDPAKPVVDERTGQPLTAKEPVTTIPGPDEKQRAEQPPAKSADPVLTEKDTKPPVTVAHNITSVLNPADSVQQKNPELTVSVPVDSAAQTAGKKTASVKTGRTEWGIAVSVGRSTITEGPGLLKSNRRVEANSLQTGSPGNLASFDRSANNPSVAWSAGAWVRQQLNPRLFLEGGLGYMYLSNKIFVGPRVDSSLLVNNYYSQGVSVNNFYRPSGGNTYTNRYHFIRLHGGLSWQFLKNAKFRPEWENGLEYNLLAGSSMLHFDYSLPGFYKDNRLLTRHHLFYYTGLNLPAGKRVWINPYASFSLTRVLRNSDTLRTNFSQWGIRLKISLDKK